MARAAILLGAGAGGAALAGLIQGSRTIFAVASIVAALCIICADYLAWQDI